MIRVEELSKEYTAGVFNRKQFKVLDEASFTVKPGETLGLVGESGSGKSTVARTMLGLIPPSSGRVYFQGQEVLTPDGRMKKEFCGKLQIIFQHPESALNPRMKIYKSMIEPMLIHKQDLSREEMKIKSREFLQQVGLSEEHLTRYPHELSGGQIQRVVLARVLSLNPQFLVADEPTSMLDASVQAQVLRILKKIQAENGIGLLFISHDIEVVSCMSDRIAVMYKGQIVESALAGELCQNPLHPYSRLLVEAFSSLEKSSVKQEWREDEKLDTGSKCHYYSHCPHAGPACRQRPVLREMEAEHYTACWLV